MRPLLLTVQSGPDRGRQISLRGEPLSIGRGASEGMQLSDSAVSRHHLTIVGTGDSTGVRVVEITGVNPVWTVAAGNRVALRAGQVLPIGAAFTVGNTTVAIAHEEVKGPGTRALELDATGLLAQPGASRLAALAALGEQLARCGSLPAVMRAALLTELGARAPLLHVKDGPAKQGEPMVAVGSGSLDIQGIVRAGSAEWLIVELDECATDMFEAVEASIRYLEDSGLGVGR